MIIAYVVLFLGVLFLSICYGAYRYCFYSPKKAQNDDHAIPSTDQMELLRGDILRMVDTVNAIPFERVTIRSRDGLELCARYYHQQKGAPLSICFHGYRGTPSRDFSGGIQILLREGHNLLVVEQRAQCKSQGHTITFGIKERYDCLDWLGYALDRFGDKTQMILVGISMGAATVLMTSELSLPEGVYGIIADCPYTSPVAIIRKVSRDMRFPPRIAGFFAAASAWIFGHFRLSSANAAEAVRYTKTPILLIHGEEDHFVPCEMSREIQSSCPEMIELHTFPGAGHGLSYLADPERYKKLICEFSKRVLSEREYNKKEQL